MVARRFLVPLVQVQVLYPQFLVLDDVMVRYDFARMMPNAGWWIYRGDEVLCCFLLCFFVKVALCAVD